MSQSIQDTITQLNKYRVVKQIGQGAYGVVFLVSDDNAKKLYARKQIWLGNQETQVEHAIQEGEIMQHYLGKTNVIKFKEQYVASDTYYIVMEYADQKCLYNLSILQKTPLSEVQIMTLFVQICQVIKIIHDENKVHCDLKSENILLTQTGSEYIIKLTDFGLVRDLSADGLKTMSARGTKSYMAPEIYEQSMREDGKTYGKPVDIWALGCILYDMIYGEHAFKYPAYEDLKKAIMSATIKTPTLDYTKNPKYLEKLIDLMKTMIKVKPKERPSIDAILNNQFIIDFIAERTAALVIYFKNQFLAGTIAIPSQPSLSVSEVFNTLSADEMKLANDYLSQSVASLQLADRIVRLCKPCQQVDMTENLEDFAYFGSTSGRDRPKPHGFGLAISPKSQKLLYIGSWIKGKPTGFGIQKLYDQDMNLTQIRTGTFLKGVQNAKGTRQIINGDYLDGEFYGSGAQDAYFEGAVTSKEGVKEEGELKVFTAQAAKELVKKM